MWQQAEEGKGREAIAAARRQAMCPLTLPLVSRAWSPHLLPRALVQALFSPVL